MPRCEWLSGEGTQHDKSRLSPPSLSNHLASLAKTFTLLALTTVKLFKGAFHRLSEQHSLEEASLKSYKQD